MTLIYSKAEEVIAWIGEESDDSALVIDQMRNRSPYPSDSQDDVPINFIKSFIALCKRLYWERIWIIQEIAVASDVVVLCGREEIKWEQLFRAFGYYRVFWAQARGKSRWHKQSWL